MKPKSLTFDMHFDKAECYIILNRYKADNTLAIDLVSIDGEPITRLTVCTADEYHLMTAINTPDNISWVDINNNPTAMNFIDEYKLGEPVRINGRIAVFASGFCEYPLYKFNLDELRKYTIQDNSKL